MKRKSNNSPPTSHSRRRPVFIVIALGLAILSALVVAELLLRLIPIPGVQFNTAHYDPLVGAGHAPNSVSTYFNARGDYVRRRINRWGYMDKEHSRQKQPATYRIGFFGDSYTEARQVPLEDTFVRLIESDLKSDNVECLAFGIIGFGTLQSYLTCMKWSDFFDLDLVVYVFCENDLGDQIREVKQSPNVPYAILTPNGYDIDNTFRQRNAHKQKLHFKVADYLTAHSLLASTIVDRVRLLAEHGVKVRVTDADRLMLKSKYEEARRGEFPNQIDPPSTWPDSLRAYAQELGEVVILKWRDEVRSQGREFAILYVPRGELGTESADQDSWKPWLESLCVAEGIAFIDTAPLLLQMLLSGKEVFYDHFTVDGHIGAADAFVTWYRARVPRS